MVALMVLGGTRVIYGSLISRETDATVYGIVGTLTAVATIASLMLPSGIGSAIARFVPFSRGAGDLAAGRGLYRLLSRMALVSAVLLAIVSGGIAVLFSRPWSDIGQVMLLTLTYSLYVTEKAGLYGFNRVGEYVRLEILGSGVTLGATILVVTAHLTWYLLPLVAGYATFVIGARLAIRPDLRGSRSRPDLAGGREVLTYVLLACVGALAGTGFLQATQLLAAGYASAASAAYFTATIALISPLYFLPRALALALFPFLSQAHGAGDWDAVRNHTDIATRALVAFMAPLFVAAELLAVAVLTLYSGGSLAGGVLVLQVVLLAAFLSVIQVPSVNALSSGSGLQLKVPVGWAVAGCLVGLASVAVLAPLFDAPGIAVGYLIGTALAASGPIIVVWRRYRTPWGRLIPTAIALILLSFGAAQMLERVMQGATHAWLLDIVVATIAAGIAALVLRHEIGAMLAIARRQRAGSELEHEPAEADVASTDVSATHGVEGPRG